MPIAALLAIGGADRGRGTADGAAPAAKKARSWADSVDCSTATIDEAETHWTLGPSEPPMAHVEQLTAPAADDKSSNRMPPGIPYIVGNEAAERFSFYGMKAILKIYLIACSCSSSTRPACPRRCMAEARARSTEVVHLFVAGVYAFPLIGAIIADRLLGKYRTILWVSLIYCAGHAVLAVAGRFGVMSQFEAAEMSMYLGLGLVAIGSGGIKPCVSANVGDQFTAANAHLVTKVFQVFYFIINYGSFFSTILTPLLLAILRAGSGVWRAGCADGHRDDGVLDGARQVRSRASEARRRLGLFDALVTMLLFTPLFSFILGYFVLWEQFLSVAQRCGREVGSRVCRRHRRAGDCSILLNTGGCRSATIAALAVGCVLFRVRQRIEASSGFLPVLLYNLTHQRERVAGHELF